MRRQSGGVDADLAHPRQMPLEHLHHLRQVVARRRLAAGDVQVLDVAPERVVHRRLELRQRHVGFAIAVLPVVAHLTARVADPRAVVDEHRRLDRRDARDDRIGQIAGHTDGRAREIPEGEGVFGHSVEFIVQPAVRGEAVELSARWAVWFRAARQPHVSRNGVLPASSARQELCDGIRDRLQLTRAQLRIHGKRDDFLRQPFCHREAPTTVAQIL